MKRSRINEIMTAAGDMIHKFGFTLPPFAYWTPEEFKAQKGDARHVIDARCGWDITDYGAGRYDEMGLFLFTLRNGLLADLQRGGGMCYAEKLLISKQDQLSPMHTHELKAEDIINRGDLPPMGPSIITRVCGFEICSRVCRSGQARRARSPQIAQALGALQRVFCCPAMSVA